jgi:hypothetical protein
MKVKVIAPKGYTLLRAEYAAGAEFDHPPGVHLDAALRHQLVEPVDEKKPAGKPAPALPLKPTVSSVK